MTNLSKHFQVWAVKQLNKPGYIENLEIESVRHMQIFFKIPKEKLIKRVKAKLEKGAKEHGSPIYSRKELLLEKYNEFLDILGWEMVLRYNEMLKSRLETGVLTTNTIGSNMGNKISRYEKPNNKPASK